MADGLIAGATLLLVIVFPLLQGGTPILTALVIISAVRSIGTGVQTPAVNAVIPQLVSEDRLMKFNGIYSMVQSTVQFVAPATAGVVLSFGSLRFALMLDVFTALVGIGLLLVVAIPLPKGEVEGHLWTEMKEGVGYAAKEYFVGRLILSFGFFIFLCVPAGFLATLFVSREYGDTYWHLTIVEVIGFLGMAGGGLFIGIWGGFKNPVKTYVVGMSTFGALAVAMGGVDSFVVYLILMAIYGIALTMVQTAATTLLQKSVPSEKLGRVFGLFGATFSGFLPLGMIVFGPLADVVSLRFLMILSGFLLLGMALFLTLNRKFYASGEEKTDNF